MSEQYRAVRGLKYPADAASLQIVLDAGGASKVAAADRGRVTWKVVEAGARCDDVPACSRPRLLAAGTITRVERAAPRRRRS